MLTLDSSDTQDNSEFDEDEDTDLVSDRSGN